MSTLLSVLGFAAQFCVIASLGAAVISSVCLRTTDSALIGEDHPTGAELSVIADDLLQSIDILSDDFDATLPCGAKSIMSPVITTTISDDVITDDYSALTIRQLKALCRERHIKGYSSLRKHELVALLLDAKPSNEFSSIIASAISEVMDDFYHDQW